MTLRAVMVLIGLALIVGAATQAVDPTLTDAWATDIIEVPQLDDAVAPTVVLDLGEPTRIATIAVWHRETRIGRIASFAPFRPPRASATSSS